MAAVPSREVTTAEITAVGFSFYTDEEVRKLSVKQITSPLVLDGLKQPIPGGLYDPALGPLESMDICATCGLRYRACPGHFGHIELAVPVYNPLVFGTLYKLLRCTCLHCFRFRMQEEEVGRYEKRMALLAEGRIVEASRVNIGIGNNAAKSVDDILGDESEHKDLLKMQGGSISVMEVDEGLLTKGCAKVTRRNGTSGIETVHTVEAARECAIEFFKKMPSGTCRNCGAHSPAIKREGCKKIFQVPLDVKKILQNQALGVSVVSALSGIAHSSHEAEELEMQLAKHMADQAGRDVTPETKEAKFIAKGKDGQKKKPAKKAAGNEFAPLRGPAEEAGTKQRYMTAAEVREIMRRLWANNGGVLSYLYALHGTLGGPSWGKRRAPGLDALRKSANAKNAYQMLFVQTVPVAPNNVRPLIRLGEASFQHPQTISLQQIININLDIMSQSQMGKELASAAKSGQQTGPVGSLDLGRSLRTWLMLQNGVNALFDSSTADNARNSTGGIRQMLEKKEGLFRKNMMGKRVNFAARSVISPDPYLGSGEIGVPPYFAVRLSVPERVTPLNVQELREMVIRGPHEHPGANAVEDENGRMLNLTQLSRQRREALAKQLLSKQGTVLSARGSGQGASGKIVYRHLRDGDIMLTNRQPTLHKPGLMAHRARVLKGERTIRMHYANCATFNADFDGDEINLHLPQDYHARAEGYEIVHADHQYIVPTDGKPIRGLIQDHVVAGVQLTKRDTFLSRADFMQLVYSAVSPTRPGFVDSTPIKLPPPAILKPQPLWTGKQVVTAVVARLTAGKAPMTLAAKCKTSEKYWGKTAGEETLIFHKGELLTGTMDKAQYGKYGLVHGVQELYGNTAAGDLLSSFSRLWTTFLQMNGFTCGITDLLLDKGAERTRTGLIAQAERRAMSASAEYAGLSIDDIAHVTDSNDPAFIKKEKEVQEALSERYRSSKATGAVHDRRTTSSLQPLSSEVVDVCLPGGLVKPFPHNCLSMMTVTGAKGSQVNFSQISCLLGQQELEGRRVPRMASGKTLPCFSAYEGGARSGGYVSDRFLTGLRPQEYYFHCMAGREGLVDTTVKTSRSGYLQRCLVKNLESLRVHYDGTVRDNCDGSVVQFQYGEDGVDVLNTSFLRKFGFLAHNADRLSQQQLPGAAEEASKAAALVPMEKEAAKLARYRQRQLDKKTRGKKAENPDSKLPLTAQYLSTLLGVTSEAYADALGKFVRSDPEGSLQPKRGAKRFLEGDVKATELEGSPNTKDAFQRLMNLRYMRSLVSPGEAVGVLAAQSVGEPSTQMTLNTFHMAGRGEANVTLGIPRLRELFMTAAQSIKTPVMTMPLLPGKTKEDAEVLANQLRRIRLAEALEDLTVEESLVTTPAAGIVRQYTLQLRIFPEDKLPHDAGITFQKVSDCFRVEFIRKLSAAVRKQLSNFDRNAAINTMSLAQAGEGEGPASAPTEAEGEGATISRRKSNKEDEDENAEENEEFDEGKLRFQGGRGEQGAMYNQGDQEDREIAAAESRAAALEEELPEEPEEGLAGTRASMLAPEASPMQEKSRGTSYETEDAVDESKHTCKATISIPLTAPKVLMLELAERIAAGTMLRHTPGIEKCYVIDGTKDPAKPDEHPPPSVQTDGINFEGAWNADETIDINRLTTNDVGSILRTYGVEAARATVMREVSSVFGAYGIAVDPRHLGLIADFMTHEGGYKACSRSGIASSKSTFLKITFETAAQFLTDATLRGVADDLASPASRIIMGRVVELGTGSFELLQKVVGDEW